MKAIKTRRVAALGATCALAAAGMFGAMAANADEDSMSGGQSGSEQSGGNGGEEGQSGGNGGEEGQSGGNGGEEGQSGGNGGEEGQSGGEEGQSGGEEGGDEGVVVDGLEISAINGNVLDTTTMLFVTWNYTDADEGAEDISLRADSDFVLDAVNVDGNSVDFTCGDVTESEYGYAYASCDLDFGPAMAGMHEVTVTSGDITASDSFKRSIQVTFDVQDGMLTQQQCSPVGVTYTVPADQLKYLPKDAELQVSARDRNSGKVASEKTVALNNGKAVVSLDPDASEDAYYMYALLYGTDDVMIGGVNFEMTVEPGCGTTGGLAQTGANAGWVALAALVTIGAGAGAVAINRRRA